MISPPFYQDDFPAVRFLFCQVEGIIMISFFYTGTRRLPFDMVGDGDGVETFFPGFLYPQCRPYDAVGEDCMDMEITFQQVISVYFG